MKQEQKLNVVVILFIFLIAPSKSDCIDEDDVDWGNYGYFQVCRSQHIKQALQVKIDIYTNLISNLETKIFNFLSFEKEKFKSE